ncbi:MAG: hypothetical protein A2Y10_19620 [Planctomycetes bacterium GWF2_41_51]|nr:MAG: hypothetical protein A2Y10_19620 [Planctomycetes bacterium GWF2_41_51]HBG28189.1 hypothetical protein [Phycisphaerales bacterium]
MKKVILGLVLLMSFNVFANAAGPTTAVPLYLLRAEADENSELIGLTTGGDFASKPAGAVMLDNLNIDQRKKNLVFYFCGGAAADKTFGYKIWAWRSNNGMAELIAEGTGVLGTQAVVKYPHTGTAATNKFWADTLTITTQGTPETFQVADAAGGDRTAKLFGYNCGYEWIYCEITDADGSTGDEAGVISVYYAYFK